MKTALVAVATGAVYERYAEQLMRSAELFFKPTEEVQLKVISGRSGWPEATSYRYHALLEHWPDANYVYLIDADMLFVSEVGAEILPGRGHGITATLHPGFFHRSRQEFPYETRRLSAAYMAPDQGTAYYCGGFVGGCAGSMRALSHFICDIIDSDAAKNLVPIWHDESALNSALANQPPEVKLSPSYCYPDNDTYYRQYVWMQSFQRKIVALDKPDEERGCR